ncbi:MAG: D-alanyl-D-alanine carboxypeptidase [Alicyclobacillus sp.]|nr:D-alanyl-D-alanine carboxypeptidase [Alicyclobacillus sp.]
MNRQRWTAPLAALATALVLSLGSRVAFAAEANSIPSNPIASNQATGADDTAAAAPIPETYPEVINETSSAGVPMTAQPIPGPSIVSQAAVVMDLNTGTVVYAKDPLVEHYPASLTKMMTALLALQDGHLTDKVTVSQDAASQPPDKLYFVPGEEKTLEQMLYGLLLISANDAAVAIAEHYGGSVAGFAQMMNAEAKTLGANHTHFDNPNGLPDPNHVTTAYDLALIARAAMQYPEFRKIVDTKSYAWHGEAWQSQLTNINQMLYSYPGCIGIKTGFTSVAHETLAVAARRGHDTFLAVLLDAPTNYAIDHDATTLLNFAFDHYHTQTVVHRGQVVGHVRSATGADLPLFATTDVVATVENGHPIQPSERLQLRPLTTAEELALHVHAADLRVSVPGQAGVIVPVDTHVPMATPALALPTTLWWRRWPLWSGMAAAALVAGYVLRRRQVRRRRLRYGVSWDDALIRRDTP